MLCLQCFYRYSQGEQCPKCGWKQGDDNPDGILPLGRILNDRYQIGGVISCEEKKTVYRCWDCNERKITELSEYQGKGRKNQSSFVYEGNTYTTDPVKKSSFGKWLLVAVCLVAVSLAGVSCYRYFEKPRVWLPQSALPQYETILSDYRVTIIPDEEYTKRLESTEQLPDAFYREGVSGRLSEIAIPIDFDALGMEDEAYPSRLEMPTGWYATVAYTHTKQKETSPEQLVSGQERVCIAEDNWDDFMFLWTGDEKGTEKALNRFISLYRKQKINPKKDDHNDLFTAKKIDWLIDDTLVRNYLTRYGTMVPLETKGTITGCYSGHWCLGTEKGYEVLELLLSEEGQRAVYADSALFPLSETVFKEKAEREPMLAMLKGKKKMLFGENRQQAYQENNRIYQKVLKSF